MASIYKVFDPLVKGEIEWLKDEITVKREFDAIAKEFQDFLALQGNFEIKNSSR